MQASESVDSRLVIPERVRSGAWTRRRHAISIGASVALALVVAVVLLLRLRNHAPSYRTARVERRSITQVVEAAGYLDANVRAEVPAPAPGQLQEIVAKVGDEVKRGQILARLDARATLIGARSAQARVVTASSRVAEAEAALSAASDALARTERLRQRELASDSELNAARAEESKARAALQAARGEQSSSAQSLRLAELSQDLTNIEAPMDGVVLKAPETAGSAVAPEQGALFVVGSSPRTLRIKADVAESDIAQVHIGQLARFSVPAFPNRSFEAHVTHTGLDAVRSGLAVRYPVELSAENPDRQLLPGMTASVRVEISHADGVLATREAALRFSPAEAEGNPSRTTLWRLEGTRLEPVRVKASISDGAYTAIEPADPSALPVGSAVVVGLLGGPTTNSAGPGIRLGKP
jgi:HlyD family secretion protein